MDRGIAKMLAVAHGVARPATIFFACGKDGFGKAF
jgi:hypothetical protein